VRGIAVEEFHMPSLAHETVTFLLTDVQGSTRLWEQEAVAMQSALVRHDALADEIITAHTGRLVKPLGEGDSLFAVFPHASHAAAAAGALQRAFQQEPWPTSSPIIVRMAIHTGEAIGREGDYYGPTVNRCARIRAVAHGGQILLSQAAYSLARDTLARTVATTRDLGEHRLRDLERPEHLYQLNWPECPADFAQIGSLDAYKHNLPRHLTSFIGREREIAEVQRLLQNSPLVTITGSGGAGKTRLAQQVAAETLERYTDGVWLAELAALADPELVPRTLANALGIPEEPGRPMLETLCRHLAGKRVLLLLDNCEHLERACALLANALLRACPNLRILATSRSRLGVGGEVAWSLPALPVPTIAAPPTLQTALDYEALRLFVDRATANRPDFALTDANLSAIARICRRLDGIPLAIELAAARVSVLTPADIAARMERSFRLFKNSDRLASERHQTLQALIDWSYNVLDEPARLLLRRLAVFVGGWTLDAVEQICADKTLDALDILDVLSDLVHNSLVIADEQNGTQRYRLLETVRRYSQEKLEEAGEVETLRDRHRHYFLELAESALPHLATSTQTTWLSRLEADHDNFRAALASSAEDETRLKLAGALWRFWMMHGHLSEGRSWLEGALNCGPNVSAATKSRALTGLGMLMMQQGDKTTTLSILEQALALRRATGSPAEIAETVNIVGIAARYQGDLDRARQCYEESLQLRHQLDDTWGIAAANNNLGMVAVDQKDFEAAQSYYTRSLAVYRELGDLARIASVSNNLGTLALENKDFEAARLYFKEALQQFRTLDDTWNVALTLHNLGCAYVEQNRYPEATALFLQSFQATLDLNSHSFLYYPLKGLADVAVKLGRHPVAAQLIGAIETNYNQGDLRLEPAEVAKLEEIIVPVRDALGQAPFQSAWSSGTALPMTAIPTLIANAFALDTSQHYVL
jgi:predicted ATPase/class 3 adenylate cyclase